MNRAEAMMRLAERYGSDVCFANPGTTELPFVAALDNVKGVRPVLGLHENVCTGAADGWARLSGRVGLAVLHLGVGLSNGLANLHNARRAHTPVVTIVGDHPDWHLRNDPPLASDLIGLASSGTTRVLVSSAFGTGSDAFNTAWAAARAAAAPVSLIVRADDAAKEQRGRASFTGVLRSSRPQIDASTYMEAQQVLQRLARADRPALLLGGNALSTLGKRAAAAVRTALDTTVFVESFPALEHAGNGLPRFESLAGLTASQARQRLGEHDLLVLVGAVDPTAFFANDPELARLRPDSTEVVAACDAKAAEGLLQAMSQYVPASRTLAGPDLRPRHVHDATPLDPHTIARILVERQPEGAVVVDESNTAGGPYRALMHRAAPHLRMGSTAGSLGFGMAAAIGSAIAAPQRRVLNLQSDGAAAYTPQALWTQAREHLDITTVLFDNGGYETVRRSWDALGGATTSSTARLLSDLDGPALDWTRISAGFGVPAIRASTAAQFRHALDQSFNASGPHLVVAALPRS